MKKDILVVHFSRVLIQSLIWTVHTMVLPYCYVEKLLL